MQLPPLTLIGDRYRIDRVLGTPGPIDTSYKAVDITNGDVVVLREFNPIHLAKRELNQTLVPRTDAAAPVFSYGLSRFHEEFELHRKLEHPNIARLTDVVNHFGTVYSVCEYENGASLSAVLKRLGGDVSERMMLSLVLPVLGGLARAHEEGLLHGCITPERIHLTSQGRPMLLELPIARAFLARRDGRLDTIVADGYSPPEQYTASGKVGPWTDVFGIGAVLFKMISGTEPPHISQRMMHDKLPGKLASVDGLDPQIRALLDAALSLDAEQRPKSMNAFRKSLLDAMPKAERGAVMTAIQQEVPASVLRPETTVLAPPPMREPEYHTGDTTVLEPFSPLEPLAPSPPLEPEPEPVVVEPPAPVPAPTSTAPEPATYQRTDTYTPDVEVRGPATEEPHTLTETRYVISRSEITMPAQTSMAPATTDKPVLQQSGKVSEFKVGIVSKSTESMFNLRKVGIPVGIVAVLAASVFLLPKIMPQQAVAETDGMAMEEQAAPMNAPIFAPDSTDYELDAEDMEASVPEETAIAAPVESEVLPQESLTKLYTFYRTAGDSLQRLGSLEDAKEQYRLALEYKASDPYAVGAIRQVDQKISQREADKRYAQIMASARASAESQDFQQARRLFESALVIKPNDPDATRGRREAEEDAASVNVAESTYLTARQTGDSLAVAGALQEALIAYEGGLALKPEDAYLTSRIASLRQSVIDQMELESLDGQQFEYHRGQADGLFRGGDFEAAVASYEEALRVRPEDRYVEGRLRMARDSLETTKLLAQAADENGIFFVTDTPPVDKDPAAWRSQIRYPKEASATGEEGRVALRVAVDEFGRVIDASVVSGPRAGCREEALRVIRFANFEPATLRGRSVKAWTSVAVTFRLR